MSRLIDADALIEFCAERWIPLNIDAVNMQPTIQPEKAQLLREGTTSDFSEPTRIIPETRAIPSDDDRVSLSERVTATFYDDEYEEWSQRTVTVRDVLDAVCDEYTVLPSAQPEPQWIPVSERLPEDGTWNIFTDGKNISVERYKADAIDHFFPNGRWFQLEDATAWMPLPEPYKPNKKQSGKEGA